VVSWAEAGVGAVATQSFAEVSYGPGGLALMRGGRSAAGALGELVDADEGEAARQVAMLDAAGRVAVHTGRGCIPEAGHQVGNQMSAQANMMRRSTVPRAMVEAYTAAAGEKLAWRLLAALDAAEADGGDIRGRQSAALLVVSGKRSNTPWKERRVELRVEDHPEPLRELRRLLKLRAAYDLVEEAERAAMKGDLAAAARHYQLAHDEAPDNIEIAFWLGLSLAGAGRVDEGRALVRRAAEVHDGWDELLRRLPQAGLLPEDPQLMQALLAD
jgi:uncharacterized Ntn-hydrolase superfamily protein